MFLDKIMTLHMPTELFSKYCTGTWPLPARFLANGHVPAMEVPYHVALKTHPACHAFVATHFAAVESDWNALAATQSNLFLQAPYLRAIEQAPPVGLTSCYLVVYKSDIPVVIAYCQIQSFHTEQHLQSGNRMRRWLFKQLKINGLVCGNLTLTGEHNFAYDQAHTDTAAAIQMLQETILHLLHQGLPNAQRFDAVLFKDVHPQSKITTDALTQKKFIAFPFQPNMVLELQPSWHTFNDYLSAMSSKYRVRARRALRKAQGIQWHSWDIPTIAQYQNELYHLYRRVADAADFNAINLHPSYFLSLKRWLTDRFDIVACYKEDTLVGFFTTIQNGDTLEAHFLGYEPQYNPDFQLYLNMLYQIIDRGIACGAQRIVFARTAMEIKSSVGAEPHDLFCYIRMRRPWLNPIARWVIQYLEPRSQWQMRHPFRDLV